QKLWFPCLSKLIFYENAVIFNHGLFSVFILLLMRLSWYSQGCSVLRLVAPLPDIFSKLTAIPVC
ncbi:MAG: hypothetical protein WCH01_22495, partial [Methylococcaceae bacterium]